MKTFDISRDHPAFEGHFPGHPILPGVVLLSEAMAAIEAATATSARDWTVDNVKFLGAVEPGSRLVITHAVQPSGGVRFEIREAERVIASGVLSRRAR
jgi:3-hydroxymyristoyl/3-hydroxydecanoyl-(acyl carrier protein) dehydratase